MSLGFMQSVLIKEAASYGSVEDLAAGTRYLLACDPNPNLQLSFARNRAEFLNLSAGMPDYADQLGLETVEGSIQGVMPIYYASSIGDAAYPMCVVLKHALGAVTTTGPAGTKYTHKFTYNDYLFPGLSVGVNRNGKLYVYHGCQTRTLRFSGTVGEAVRYEWSPLGKTETIAAAATAGTLTNPTTPFYWIMKHGAVTVDAASTPISSFDLSIENQLEADGEKAYAIGSNQRVVLAKSAHNVTGTVKRRLTNDGTASSKFYLASTLASTALVVLTFTHPTDADFTFIIALQVKFEEKSPVASDRGPIMEDIPFTAYNLSDATKNYITVTDKQAVPATATGSYDGTS